jgi:DNA-directed RNA polymerase specialized sigma24 family protein
VRTYLYGIALKLVAAERRKQGRDEPPAEDTVEELPDQALWVRQALEKLEPGPGEYCAFEAVSVAHGVKGYLEPAGA